MKFSLENKKKEKHFKVVGQYKTNFELNLSEIFFYPFFRIYFKKKFF